MTELVTIEKLCIEFKTRNGIVQAVNDVSFSLKKGEMLGIVGESGSGKSVTSYALMRILDKAGSITKGSVYFSGVDIRNAKKSDMRDLRGREMSMIFQNPRAALNPIRKVGQQIEDVIKQHALAVGISAKEKAIEILKQVKIRDAEQRYHAYPFELSGGMCQRVVIALALSCQPRLLIADEPTTGLDVTTQKTIMDLIADLAKAKDLSTILITHDLGLASAYCDRIIVMQSGKVVETASTKQIFSAPEHAYTRKLMRATPRIGCNVRELLPEDQAKFETTTSRTGATPSKTPLLQVKNLIKEFPVNQNGNVNWLSFLKKSKQDSPSQKTFRAVDDISFTVQTGSSIGLVGESGCGKSTTSAMIMRLLSPTSGTIKLENIDLTSIPQKRFARSQYRSQLQMVFQDPTDSLNPRFTAKRAISDPVIMLGSKEDKRFINGKVEELATLVGLPLDLLERFPHQLSGGQKARVGIARAIALNPKLLILDEPTAALDVSVQAVVLNLLYDLKTKLNMSYLFVSHDLNVVRLLCDEVIVMQAGRIIEQGNTESMMSNPKSDYTKTLIEAVPQPPL